MKAVAFDLGDTLVEYEGLPFSWEKQYPEALQSLVSSLGLTARPGQIEQACAVLRRYNTRIHPRVQEAPFSAILEELSRCFDSRLEGEETALARSFFRIFRQRLRCFPDSKAALEKIRSQNLKIGVFTDVPYGMPRPLVIEDVDDSGLTGAFDVLITSRDIGWRKPSVATLQSLAKALECSASDMIYVGNEQKDIEVAKAFGCPAVLLDRQKQGHAWGQDRTIVSLAEL